MLEILYEDKDLIAVNKPVGYSSEFSKSENLPELIQEYLGEKSYIGIIHRLDTSVAGAILYAKNKKAAALMSDIVRKNEMTKEYLAVVSGEPNDEGRFEDLLFKDSKKNKTYVVKRERKGVKKAVLSYINICTISEENRKISLVKVKLQTGRSHQIRVQFASRKMPIFGDGKYGSREKCDIALFSHRISFNHPISKHKVNIISCPDKFPFTKFKELNI